jgi:hypothetical protein
MLLPALNMTREKTKTIACGANLKQIIIAFNFYTDDNNGWCSTGDHYTGGSWSTVYNELGYIMTPKIFGCPSEGAKPSSYSSSQVHYGLNVSTFGLGPASTLIWRQIKQPMLNGFPRSPGLIVFTDGMLAGTLPGRINHASQIKVSGLPFPYESNVNLQGPYFRHEKKRLACAITLSGNIISYTYSGAMPDHARWSPRQRNDSLTFYESYSVDY